MAELGLYTEIGLRRDMTRRNSVLKQTITIHVRVDKAHLYVYTVFGCNMKVD